ncbi:unnamed protein product [Paramecium sonneborni]|uniref:Dynein heavy chain hydrolytic ATP-binding dynein motor region domain-containing protein n=1 Tax=Paramecium sonneborni TaxID=65129 RepID=A0A8S1RV28_9CILI|nr:unnamed protein product [Paramecium sonneborni]
MTLIGALKLNLGGGAISKTCRYRINRINQRFSYSYSKIMCCFNCLDQMEYFKVAWVCFDEFNRINIEVLSVIAQQLLILFGSHLVFQVYYNVTIIRNDGIFAYTIREICKDQTTERNWIMFDSPVDAKWIESINTVLDHNKKICLNQAQKNIDFDSIYDYE